MEDKECPICLIPFSDNNNAIITLHCCNHQFHSSCYIKCIKLKNECPLCRKNLNEQKEEEEIITESVIIPVQNDETMLVLVSEGRCNVICCSHFLCTILTLGGILCVLYFFIPR